MFNNKKSPKIGIIVQLPSVLEKYRPEEMINAIWKQHFIMVIGLAWEISLLHMAVSSSSGILAMPCTDSRQNTRSNSNDF